MKNQKKTSESEKKLREYEELTVYNNKDIDRIEQQINNLKETSKTDSKAFEQRLKEQKIASEKRRIGYEACITVREKKNTLHLNDNRKESREPNSLIKSTCRPLCTDDRVHSRIISDTQRRNADDFNKLVFATGIEDVSILIEKFIQMEEDNFKEFQEINEINFEIQDLESQVAQLKLTQQELNSEVKTNNAMHKNEQETIDNEKKLLTQQRTKISVLNEEIELKLKDVLKEACNLFYVIGAENLIDKTTLKNDFMRIENLPEIFKTIESRFLEIIYAYSTITSNVTSLEEPDASRQGTE